MDYLTKDEVKLATIGGEPYLLLNFHSPKWWNRIINNKLPKPIKLKFDKKIRRRMPQNIKKGKGIYMFFIETNHPFPEDVYMRHILYVGRVQKGNTDYNFFKRFYMYVKDIGNKNSARNRMRLTNLWPNLTYVYFFDLSDRTDSEIVNIEKNIFNNICPPLNEELHGDSGKTRKL